MWKYLLLLIVIAGNLPAQVVRKWYYAESPHFCMLSGADPDDSQAILANFEAFRDALSTLFGHPPLKQIRTTIVVFRYPDEFAAYRPTHGDLVGEVAAYTARASDEALIAMSNDNRSASLSREIIQHEQVHLFFEQMQFPLPLWLNEGQAEFYSNMDIGRREISYGLSKHEHRDLLVAGPNFFRPLSWLFNLQPSSTGYNEGLRQGIFYAESWALVNYWVCGPDPTTLQKFARFMELIQRPGADSATCMQQAFGRNEAQMLADLEHFVRDGRYKVRSIPRSAESTGTAYRFRPATVFERDFILADLKVRARNDAASAYEMVRLANAYPESPRPEEVLGSLAAGQADWTTAIEHWDRAIKLHTDNPAIYVLRAGAALVNLTSGDSLDYRLPDARVRPLTAGLRQALVLDSNDTQAVEQLALLESIAAHPEPENVEYCLQHLRPLRDKRSTVLSLAIILWRSGNKDESRRLLQLVENAGNLPPFLRERAEALGHRLDQRS